MSGYKRKFLMIAATLALLPQSVFSASILATPFGIGIEGEIVPGDAKSFVETFLHAFRRVNSGEWPQDSVDQVFIEGPGGDLYEAMRIGRFVRGAHMRTGAGGDCASACFFILAAGLERESRGARIGLHRPRFESSVYQSKTAEEGAAAQHQLQDASRSFLVEMDIPESFIDEIFAVSSNELRWVDGIEVQQRIGMVSPGLGEWYAANCGALTTDEKYDIDKFDGAATCKKIQQHNLENPSSPLPSMDYCPGYESYISKHSKSYWNYLDSKRSEIDECARGHKTSARFQTLANNKHFMELMKSERN